MNPTDGIPNGQKVPATHAVTTPNKKPPTELEVFKATLVGDYQKQVSNYFIASSFFPMK